MGSNTAHFEYGLRALLRLRAAEFDAAKAQLAAANLRVTACTRLVEEQRRRLTELEVYQRELSREGTVLDIESRLRLHACLLTAVVEKAALGQSLTDATKHHDQMFDQLRSARQTLETLERHRERAVDQFEVEQHRKALVAADELYLSSRDATTAMITGSKN